MAYGAILIFGRRVECRLARGAHAVSENVAMTLKAKLSRVGPFEHLRIRRTVRCMTYGTAFDLQRRVLEYEWPLLIGMTFQAGSIRACRQT